jgi:methyltransferase family protein
MLARIRRRLFPLAPGRWPPQLAGRGIEIGAHGRPMPGIRPFYVDRFREFAGGKCPAHVLADAAALPFRDSSLDYLACSHVLEHLANPAGAIVEWYRAVKPGGVIYMVVPDRRLTFDWSRERTPVAHLVDDFDRGTRDSDPTHIDEFFDCVDLRQLNPSLQPGQLNPFREETRAANHQAAREGKLVGIHFHVFESEDVLGLLRALAAHPKARLQYQILDLRTFFPPGAGNGFLVALRSMKPAGS